MKELINIVEKISRKKGLRDADKVSLLFSRLELREPDREFDLEGVRERIRVSVNREKKLPSKKIKTFPLRVSLATAALAVFAVSAYFSISFFRPVSPSGEVHLVRGEAFIEDSKGRRVSAGKGSFSPGDKIITLPDSAADVRFTGDVLVRVTSETELVIQSFENRRSGSSLALFLNRGTIAASVKKSSPGDSFSVATAGSLTRVRGTLFTVSVVPGGASRITLLEGKVMVEPRSAETEKKEPVHERVVLEKGEFCTVPSPEPLLKPEAVKIAVAPVSTARIPELNEAKTFLASHAEKTGKFDESETGAPESRDAKGPVFDHGDARYILTLPGEELLKIRERKIIKTTAAHKVIWSRNIGLDASRMPLVGKNRLYLPLTEGNLAALSSSDGRILWNTALDGTSVVSLLKHGGSLFVATAGSSYFRIDQKGKIVWKNRSMEPCRGSAVITGSLYFVSLKGGMLLGFDQTRGIKVFRRRFSGDLAHAAAFGNVVFLSLSSGKLIAFDYQSDDVLWEMSLEDFSVRNSIAADTGIYLFSRKGSVVFIDNSGKVLWKRETGSAIVAAPVLEGPHIHILGKEIFLVIEKTSGNVLWTVVVPPVAGNNLILSGKKILFYTRQKGLHTLKK